MHVAIPLKVQLSPVMNTVIKITKLHFPRCWPRCQPRTEKKTWKPAHSSSKDAAFSEPLTSAQTQIQRGARPSIMWCSRRAQTAVWRWAFPPAGEHYSELLPRRCSHATGYTEDGPLGAPEGSEPNCPIKPGTVKWWRFLHVCRNQWTQEGCCSMFTLPLVSNFFKSLKNVEVRESRMCILFSKKS